jgi:hypothetical protein
MLPYQSAELPVALLILPELAALDGTRYRLRSQPQYEEGLARNAK